MPETTLALAFTAFFGGMACGVLIATIRFMGQIEKYRQQMDHLYEARSAPKKHPRHDDESWR